MQWLSRKSQWMLICCVISPSMLTQAQVDSCYFRGSMSPPSYADLGKSARDVFGKGFHFGQVRIEQIQMV